MKLLLLAVGRPRGEAADLIAEYESRARRYFPLDVGEVKEEAFRRAGDAARVRDEEGKRLLARVPAGVEIVALHETGKPWTSQQLADWLNELGVRGSPGAAFVVGGAYGLSDEILARARHRLSLSAMTLPHEIARLVLAEQLYRAGTILRGEPYHKGRD
ncbi:23S rRNA (pseudouridine(1915)-N(3))-methyltransferase RlmH [Longimicrobium sp.]|uniref:23S rRNA (pseudouridine(1915)-N(3))-methyltransferase RlmH n=1 Tax=Longimicrobium sp. TaxID=2029185 RepID=UPI002CC017DF|nr:23S rRNA (pseudouridine(1915)-N(3))-methyltransferase RlmH [Longimicrobium sp.]HSU16553.1 23S rRNA (pseudouridine(1915)-N(3))-methyltransferase RlmH [Longimicrobium sp.]